MSESENNAYQFVQAKSNQADANMLIHDNPSHLVDSSLSNIPTQFLVDRVIPAGQENPNLDENQFLVDRVIPAGQVNLNQDEHQFLVDRVIPAGQVVNQPSVQIDMTNAVESVLDRMVKKNEDTINLLSTTLANHLAKLTGSIEALATSRNAGKLPADLNCDRNTGKLPVGPGQLPDQGVLSLAGDRQSSITSCHRSRGRSAESSGGGSRSSAASNRKRGRSPSRSPPVATKSTSTKLADKRLDGTQSYWGSQTADYEPTQDFGPEISSSLAGASKVFWSKQLTESKEKNLLETSRIPSNCQFLSTKLVNKEIWHNTAGDIRSKDWSLQKIQETNSNMSSNLLQAADELDIVREQLKSLAKENPSLRIPNLNPAVDKIRDALKLAGRTDQKVNEHRREAFKPSLPKDLKKLVERPEDLNSALLFGDDLKARMEKIKGDTVVQKELEKYDFKKTEFQGKRSNWQTPQNSRSGSYQGYTKQPYQGYTKQPYQGYTKQQKAKKPKMQQTQPPRQNNNPNFSGANNHKNNNSNRNNGKPQYRQNNRK